MAETAIDIPAPAGTLQASLHQSTTNDNSGFLMCHPHPLFDGTMHNKVVTTATRTAAGLGLSTLRFNFRGVGDSSGQHDQGRGETDDVLAAIRYARQTLGWQTLYLGGFSFGAGMACLAACQQPGWVQGLFLVAPAVHHFDAPNQLPFEFDSHVYMGDADEVVPFDEVDDWVARLVPQPHWHVFSDGGHFFHGRLTDLKQSLQQDLQTLLASTS